MKKAFLTNETIADLCSALQYQIHAGISSAAALDNIVEDTDDGHYRDIVKPMAEQADEGENLSAVFRNAGCFPDYIPDMIEAGEKTGKIEEALSSIATGCESRASLDRKMKSALLYPSILLLIMLVVIAVLLIYVLPIFDDVYSQLGSGLTGLAAGLLGLGKSLSHISPVLIALFAIIVIFLALFASSASFRERMLNAWWKSRGEKGVSGKLGRARFAQILSMCMSSGLSVEDAIESASKMLSEFPSAVEKSKNCLDSLNNGLTLSAALGENDLLPKSQCRLLDAGIRSGSGELAMEQIAARMTEDGDSALEESISKIEPSIVIISSVLVGLILLAVMLPLINIMSAIG
jgi:Type II secretory pathway, component PulF